MYIKWTKPEFRLGGKDIQQKFTKQRLFENFLKINIKFAQGF